MNDQMNKLRNTCAVTEWVALVDVLQRGPGLRSSDSLLIHLFRSSGLTRGGLHSHLRPAVPQRISSSSAVLEWPLKFCLLAQPHPGCLNQSQLQEGETRQNWSPWSGSAVTVRLT